MLGPDDRANAGEASGKLDKIPAMMAGEMKVQDAARILLQRPAEILEPMEARQFRVAAFGEAVYPDPGGGQSRAQRADLGTGRADGRDRMPLPNQPASEQQDVLFHPSHVRAVGEEDDGRSS